MSGSIGLPVIGNGLLLLESSSEVFTTLHALIKQYGKRFYLKFGHRMYVFITKPEDIEIILNSPNAQNKDEVYSHLAVENKKGLLALNGEEWQSRRQLLEPCFDATILTTYVPIFNRCASILADRMETVMCRSRLFDAKEIVNEYSMNAIVETSMGKPKLTTFQKDSPLVVAFQRMMSVLSTQIFQVWLQSKLLFRFTKYYNTFKKDLKVVETFIRGVLITEQKTEHFTWMHQLLEISKSSESTLDEQGVLAEGILSMMVGNEQSATVMANTLLLLAMHPEAQAKVFAELNRVCKDQNSEISMKELNQLDYLDLVMKESMRVATVTPVITRKTSARVKLSDGVILSEGVYLSMLMSEVHHSMEIWGKDADEFRPERFAINNKRHPYSFVPFSGGPRTCVGIQFAPILMKIGLAQLLRTYEFSTELNIGELKWSGGLTQQLMKKHLVFAAKRKWAKAK